MPSPSTSLATLRPDLSASLMAFDLAADRAGFVGLQVAPVLEVAKPFGRYGKIPLESLLQNRNTLRSNSAGYSRSNYTFTDASFSCLEYGAEEPVDDRSESMYSLYFDAELIAAQRALDAVLRGAEQRWAAKLFNTTTYTGSSLTTAVGTTWDNAADATPIDDVEGAVLKVYANTGIWPNAIIISRKTFRLLRNCEQVLTRIAAHGAGSPIKASDVTANMLAQVFDLAQVIVAGGSVNTANEGQVPTLGQIWDDSMAMVAKVAVSNDPSEPCVGRTFHWAEDGSQIGGTLETYRDEAKRCDVVRARHDVDEVIPYTEMGHLLTALVD